MKKVTVFLIAVLAAIALAVLVLTLVSKEQFRQRETEQAARLRQEQIDQLRPLMSEKQTLQREINEVNASISGNERQSGMATILYCSPSQHMQEDALNLMHTYSIEGTILITPQALPGQEGYMSVDVLRELTDAGWDLCVPYMDERAMTQLLDRISQCGLPAPQSLLFEKESMDAGIASYVAKFNFKTVIYTGRVSVTDSESVFFIHAYSHREDSAKINAVFETLQSGRNYIVITVDFTVDDADEYNHARMESILDYCAYYEIAVAPISELAADNQLYESWRENKAVLTAKLEQLNQQLADVQQQIDEINRQLAQ